MKNELENNLFTAMDKTNRESNYKTWEEIRPRFEELEEQFSVRLDIEAIKTKCFDNEFGWEIPTWTLDRFLK